MFRSSGEWARYAIGTKKKHTNKQHTMLVFEHFFTATKINIFIDSSLQRLIPPLSRPHSVIILIFLVFIIKIITCDILCCCYFCFCISVWGKNLGPVLTAVCYHCHKHICFHECSRRQQITYLIRVYLKMFKHVFWSW